jgi:hypothetical protein
MQPVIQVPGTAQVTLPAREPFSVPGWLVVVLFVAYVVLWKFVLRRNGDPGGAVKRRKNGSAELEGQSCAPSKDAAPQKMDSAERR